MQINVLREACCAADDQAGPLEATFDLDDNATLVELVEQIRASRFLQFSSTHNRISGEIDDVPLVEISAPDGPAPVFYVSASAAVSNVIGNRTLHFRFRGM
jgi:hypothetical protein